MSGYSLYGDPVPLAIPPFGYASATITDGHHVYVEIDECLIHRVMYRATLHLNKWADGTWHLGSESERNEWTRYRNASYLSRKGSFEDPSRAAWETLYSRVASAAVQALATIDPALFHQAQVRQLERYVETAQAKVLECQEALRVAEDAEHTALANLEEEVSR